MWCPIFSLLGCRILTFLLLLVHLSTNYLCHIHAQEDAGASCTLCADGSPPSIPEGIVVVFGEEWECQSLSQLLEIFGLEPEGDDCKTVQFRGFTGCGCPTFPTDSDFCSLCPGGSSDLPFPEIAIPGKPGVTCGDILFGNESVSCQELRQYTRLCRCPEPCSLCRYSDEVPLYSKKVLPFWSRPDHSVTCEEYAAKASQYPLDQCHEYKQAPVPVDIAGYCGCPLSGPVNTCKLCGGNDIIHGGITIPKLGGMTCRELDDYVKYITDEQSCLSIASMAEPCCQTYTPCPICPDGTNGLGRWKVYEPYGLGCDRIGWSNSYGYPLTCEMAQQRFPYFCGCRSVNSPSCSVCPNKRPPPYSGKFIPLLNMTCQALNDFVSLRTEDECDAALANFKIDVTSFCGCTPNGTPQKGICSLCPADQELITFDDDTVFMPTTLSSTTISMKNNQPTLTRPYLMSRIASSSSRTVTCNELYEFAPHVIGTDLCRAVRQSTAECCRPIGGTQAPTNATNSGNGGLEDGFESGLDDLFTTIPPVGSPSPVSSNSTPIGGAATVASLSSLQPTSTSVPTTMMPSAAGQEVPSLLVTNAPVSANQTESISVVSNTTNETMMPSPSLSPTPGPGVVAPVSNERVEDESPASSARTLPLSTKLCVLQLLTSCLVPRNL